MNIERYRKSPDFATSYRPISQLWNLYKVYELIILQPVGPLTEEKYPKLDFVRENAALARSLTWQRLYEEGLITGVALIDLTTAYETLWTTTCFSKSYTTLAKTPT